MSVEELSRRLEAIKRRRAERYVEYKGFMRGIRLQKLDPIQNNFLSLHEWMMDEFNDVWNQLLSSLEQEIGVAKVFINIREVFSNLETKIKELETNIQQIRKALDEEFHLFQTR